MMSPNAVKCNVCLNRISSNVSDNKCCKAYPKGIPYEVLSEVGEQKYVHCNETEYGFVMSPDEPDDVIDDYDYS